MIFQAPRQSSLCLHLAPGSRAEALISAADSWRAAAGAAPRACDTRLRTPIPPSTRQSGHCLPTSQPPSLWVEGWKHGSAGPSPPPGFISPFVSCPPLYVWVSPPHALTSLTSPAGNASCLATLILFSRWSALSSLPQLVSGPEAKGAQEGKQCRTTLGSHHMLN